MKKFTAMVMVALIATLMVFAQGGSEEVKEVELSRVQAIIKEAEGMTLSELAQKAIEESNGKTFYGLGNSSRGKTALPNFIAYLQTIDPSYTLTPEWSQPKNNSIFTMLAADGVKAEGTYAMTLIQDGNQIESKMVQKQMEQQLQSIKDIFHSRLSTRSSCTTAQDPSPMTTSGTLSHLANMDSLWMLTVKS